MQDLVAEYQQYQDATYVPFIPHHSVPPSSRNQFPSAEEEGEYEEELPVEEE